MLLMCVGPVRGGFGMRGAVRLGWRRVVVAASVWLLAGLLVPSVGGAQESSVVLAFASGGSLSDVGTAASLVAAGGADAVVLVGSEGLSDSAAGVVRGAAPVRAVLVGGTAVLAASVGSRVEGLSDGVSVERFAGADRAETAAVAARRAAAGRQGVSVALANGWSLADVGVAASLVAAGGADVVLYGGIDALGDATAAVLEELAVSEVVAVGGTAALPQAVVDAALAAAGVGEARRLSGSTRVDTAARAARSAAGGCTDTVVVANGWSDADVGAAAGLAAALEDAAVLYAQDADTAGDAAVSALERLDPVRIVIIGGTDTVSDALAGSLTASSPRKVDRYTDPADATQHALSHTDTACDTGSSGSSSGSGSGSGSAQPRATPPQQQQQPPEQQQQPPEQQQQQPPEQQPPEQQQQQPRTSSDAQLDVLTVEPGGLVFDAAMSAYEVSVGNATDTVTVTAGPAVAGSAVRIVPADADGAVGHQVALNEIGMYGAGSTTTITVTVTATDTTTKKDYVITVERAGDPSANPLLDSLTIDPGELWPAFDAAKDVYDVPVPNATTTVTIAAGPAVAGAVVEILPADADSATGHQVTLNETGMYAAGSTTTITVTVTATDTTTTKTYQVKVIRAGTPAWARDPSKDIRLSTLDLYWPPIPYDAARDGTGPWARFEPGGIWSDGTTMWASDGGGRLSPSGTSDRPANIYAYSMATKARDQSKDLPDPGTDRSRPGFLWSDTETMWVLDYEDDVVRAINMSTGAADTDKDFGSLESNGGYRGTEGEHLNGIWSDGTTLYIAIERGFGTYKSDTRVDAYDLATGNRVPSKDINSLWAAGNRSPNGMWSDGITLWVADAWKVFAYNLATGNRQARLEFHASFGYTEILRDIWSDGRTMWISYDHMRTARADWLYAFGMPKTGLLHALTLSGVDVPFKTSRSSYAVEVLAATTSVTVSATPAFADSDVTILPADSDTATAGHQISLNTTGATEITITSINGRESSATTGGDLRTYTITVTRGS